MKIPVPDVGYLSKSCWSGRLSAAVKTRQAMGATVVCPPEQETVTLLLKTPLFWDHKLWRQQTAAGQNECRKMRHRLLRENRHLQIHSLDLLCSNTDQPGQTAGVIVATLLQGNQLLSP